MSSGDANLPLIPADGFIRISDGASPPLVVEDFYEDGTFKASGLREGQMTATKFKRRGRGYALRRVEDQDVPFSFEVHLMGFSGGVNGQVADAFLKKGAWVDATSTSASRGDVHTLKVEFFARTSEIGGSEDAVLTLKYCDGELEPSEGAPGKLAVGGTAYVFGDDDDSVSLS